MNEYEYRMQNRDRRDFGRLVIAGALGGLLYHGLRQKSVDAKTLEYDPGEVMFSGDRTQPYINLTFDDFWGNPGYVERNLSTILRLGQDYGAHFTLFPAGSNLYVAPDLWKQAAQEGHEIENHTYSHIFLGGSSRSTVLYEMQRHQQEAQRVLGVYYVPQRFFRPPGGVGVLSSYNPQLYAAARDLGLTIAVWSASSPGVLDYPRADEAEITRIVRSIPINRGDLVLQHAITADVVAAERILQIAQDRGLNSRTLAEEVDSLK